MNYLCPDCRNRLEQIRACGCNDLFCNHCNQLVSRKRAVPETESEQRREPAEDATANAAAR